MGPLKVKLKAEVGVGIWGLVQIVFNIFLLVGFGVCILRLSGRRQDDPRLSRALQLLQSKLSVLEDLSDRTDLQVQKINTLLEQKLSQVQEKIEVADQKILALHEAVDQGIETVRLAQSSLRPEDVLEQKSSIKYTKAAKMAFAGDSIEQICAALDMNRAEAEFITKVNRESLLTSASNASSSKMASTSLSKSQDFSEIFDMPKAETSPTSSLSRLAEEFKKANHLAQEETRSLNTLDFEKSDILIPPMGFGENEIGFIETTKPSVTPMPATAAATVPATPPRSFHRPSSSRAFNEAPVVRKVVFPRIDPKS
jgi:hypothetical protein